MEHQTIKDLDKELRDLETRKRDLEDQRKNMLKDVITNSPMGELAIMLHDEFCTYNHTDGCSWHYEIKCGVHDWSGHTHLNWLKRTESVAEKISHMDVGYILDQYEALRTEINSARIY